MFDGASCEASTECCRFGITGREPSVTSIERAAIERAVAARGGALARKRRALPIARGDAERVCPHLDDTGRCSVYAWRPLGCRTYFCDRADVPRRPDRVELRRLVQRL